jgi:CRP-like cAMP-binding protein
MIKALAFLGVLDDGDVEWLVANSKRQDLQSGSVLIRQGEPVGFLYLILDGALNVTIPLSKKHQVARLYAGELAGEMSFVDSHPPSATVTAGMPSSVLAIANSDLAGKIENDIGFAARFYKGISVLLSDRLRAADNGAYSGEVDLRAAAEKADLMETLTARFHEIQRRLELQGRGKGA